MSGKHGTVWERFWKKVDKNGPLPPVESGLTDLCYQWTASTNTSFGGGLIGTPNALKTNGWQMESAGRVMYQWAYGKLPPGAVVRRRCKNNKCVNPRHLYADPRVRVIRETNRRRYGPITSESRQRSRIQGLIRRYNLSLDGWNALMERQNGRCAICFQEPPVNEYLHVDHDHACCPPGTSCGNCIRGLLCKRCNTGVGMLNDNPETLRRAAEYVQNHDERLAKSNHSSEYFIRAL